MQTDDFLHDLVRLAFHAFEGQLERATITHGVSRGQWRMLRQLWRSNGICQHELAGLLGVSDATAAVALRELEKKGLVDRRRNIGNRREVLIFLTPHGDALEHVLVSVARHINDLATRDIPKCQMRALENLLRRVVGNLDRG
ncbi:MAG: MarR family transcriptional regulator [Sphingomonadales bacterium]|nr:MAG: MarR family transcriptional regulator [Sphingomonadales bacterium]